MQGRERAFVCLLGQVIGGRARGQVCAQPPHICLVALTNARAAAASPERARSAASVIASAIGMHFL